CELPGCHEDKSPFVWDLVPWGRRTSFLRLRGSLCFPRFARFRLERRCDRARDLPSAEALHLAVGVGSPKPWQEPGAQLADGRGLIASVVAKLARCPEGCIVPPSASIHRIYRATNDDIREGRHPHVVDGPLT